MKKEIYYDYQLKKDLIMHGFEASPGSFHTLAEAVKDAERHGENLIDRDSSEVEIVFYKVEVLKTTKLKKKVTFEIND
jgi:hypothetical protein